MSRRLEANHERMFAVFAGDDAKAAEAHEEFAAWLAANRLGSGSLLSAERAAQSATPHAVPAEAFAAGNPVAFASSPSLLEAAHETAHVVQQREPSAPAATDPADPVRKR